MISVFGSGITYTDSISFLVFCEGFPYHRFYVKVRPAPIVGWAGTVGRAVPHSQVYHRAARLMQSLCFML